jgi:hypothetical protein
MKQKYSKLAAISLTPEGHARTCNYWYLVQHSWGPHTAFTTRRGLDRWLEERGLRLAGELAHNAVHSEVMIEGEYASEMHHSYDQFYALENVILETKDLSNGDWTLARITRDENGIRTVHTLNPNCRHRPVFDYNACREVYK